MFFQSARAAGREATPQKIVGVEEQLLDARPTWRGDDDVADQAEDDDRAQRATTTPPGRSRPSSRDERLPSSSGGVVGATPLMSG